MWFWDCLASRRRCRRLVRLGPTMIAHGRAGGQAAGGRRPTSQPAGWPAGGGQAAWLARLAGLACQAEWSGQPAGETLYDYLPACQALHIGRFDCSTISVCLHFAIFIWALPLSIYWLGPAPWARAYIRLVLIPRSSLAEMKVPRWRGRSRDAV